jgi:hypothetical protein
VGEEDVVDVHGFDAGADAVHGRPLAAVEVVGRAVVGDDGGAGIAAGRIGNGRPRPEDR